MRNALIIAIAAFILLTTLCFLGMPEAQEGFSAPRATKASSSSSIHQVQRDGPIEGCEERGLQDKIVYIGTPSCPNCRKAKPIIDTVIEEEKLGGSYIEIDTRDSVSRKQMDEYRISVRFVPTLISGCRAHVGARNKEAYRKIMKPKS